MNTATQFIPTFKPTGKDNYEIILDDLEFGFPKTQLAEIEFMHNRGFSVLEIAYKVKRNEYETLMALIHLHREERLKKPIRRI